MSIFAAWLFAAITLAFILATGLLDRTEKAPRPPASDGEAISPAHWSAPVLAPRPAWPSPDRAVYLSSANFTLGAFAPYLFLRARGWAYQGTVEVLQHEHGELTDQVGVRLTAKFSDEKSRNQVGVWKLRRGEDEGIGIYVSHPTDQEEGEVREV